MASRVTDGEKLLKVKKTLRALLLSSKTGCSPRSLSDDYKYLYGRAIPHKELGFSSLMDLLYHMKDVVVVQHRAEGTRLFGIADDSTRHIARMVARQSGGKKGKSISVPTHPTVSMVTRRGTSWASKEPPLPKPPLTFQAQLKTLFLSYPNGVALHDFAEAFARRFGYYFSYRGWGFTSLEQVLKSIPEVITIETDPARSCQIVKLVKATSERREGVVEGVRRPSAEAINSQKLDMSVSVEVPKSQSGTESLNSLELSPKKKATTSAAPSTKGTSARRRITVPKKVVGQIETILRAFPAGIWISRFPVQFKKYFDEDLPVSTLGFSSVVHMLTSTPVCEVERPTGMGDWLVFRKGGPRPKVADNHQFLHEAYVSDKLVKDIHKLMQLHQKGIPLNKFVSQFEEVTRCELPVEEMGFNSITELLQKVPGIDVSKPPDSTKLMVFCTTPITDSETESSSDCGERMSAKDKDALLSDVSSQNRPRSVYSKQPPPSKDVRMCPVYVTHVKTPSCFSVQLIGERTTKALETLHDDMASFFNSKDGNSYAIKEPYVGQACCSIFNNDGYWYRSEIVSLPAFDVVEVHYVDYGNSAQVPLASLRRPKAHYLTLPSQSINCRLANLKPAGSTWSRTATQLLYQMTKDKAIVAIISSIQENCLSVCLCDTNTDRDIHINDCLCNQGLAMFNADSLEDQNDFDGYELESATLISADKEDVRSPGDLGKIASVSLKSVSSTQPSRLQPDNLTTPNAPPPPSTQSSLPSLSLTHVPVSESPSFPLAAGPTVPPNATSSTKPFPFCVTPVPPLQQMSLTQQLQMQNYMYFQQLLLAQQNAMFNGGAMPPIVPLQGIANPLAGQASCQTGLGSGQVSFPPPGFAPPGLAQNNKPAQHGPVVSSLVGGSGNRQNVAGQTGMTTQPVSASLSSASTISDQISSGQASLTALTTQKGMTSLTAPHVEQAPPTSTASSTHDQPHSNLAHPSSSSTHLSEAATVPSVLSEAAVVIGNGGSAQSRFSSSSLSSPTDDSSSLSSEGEILRSSHKLGSCAESCLADSESEVQGTSEERKTAARVSGESQLFFSGGAQSPSWTKEKAFIKRVSLTKDYSLSVLRHDDRAYFLSSEVSTWFWESDLLQSMLRQVQKPCWGLLMTEKKNRKLFQTLRKVQFTSRLMGGRQQITVYTLEDLPQIVTTFNAPDDLCTAVNEQVEAWQVLGLTYFTRVSADEIQLLEKTLAELKKEKKNLVQVILTEDEGQESVEEEEIETNFTRLTDVRKKIADISKRLTKLKKVAGVSLSSKPSGSSLSSVSAQSELATVTSYARRSDSDAPEPVAEVEGHATVPPDTLPTWNGEVKGQTDVAAAQNGDIKDHVDATVAMHMSEVKGQTVECSSYHKGDSSSCQGDAPRPVIKLNTGEQNAKESSKELSVSLPVQSSCLDVRYQPSGNGVDLVSETDTSSIDTSTRENSSVQRDDVVSMVKSDSWPDSIPVEKDAVGKEDPFSIKNDGVHVGSPAAAESCDILSPSTTTTSSNGNTLNLPEQDDATSCQPPSSFSSVFPSSVNLSHTYHQPSTLSSTQQHTDSIPVPSASSQAAPTCTVSSNLTPCLPPQLSTIANDSSTFTSGETPPTVTPTQPGSPPKLTSNVITSVGHMTSTLAPCPLNSCTSTNYSQSLPAFSQPFAPMEFSPPGVPVATPGFSQPPVRRRPVGIGRGGRPLSPLDVRTVGAAGMYPPGKPIVRVSPRRQQLPYYYVPQPQYLPQGKGLLPLPGSYSRPATPIPVTPLPVAPEERWIYMNHRQQYVYGNGKLGDFPPLGSGAGLDII